MPTGIPTNRTSVTLPAELSQEVLQKARDASVVMQLATRVALPGRGVDIPTITGDPEAEWVGETDAKPVKKPGIGLKQMRGHTLSVILPFSNQFRRDLPALYDNIVARMPGAMGRKVDGTVIGRYASPGTGFDTLSTATVQSIIASEGHTAYNGLTAAYSDIAENGGLLTGFALSPYADSILLDATDSTGRPLFASSVSEGPLGRILGAQVAHGRGLYKPGTAAAASSSGSPALVGIAGDWTQAMYGLVNDLEMSFSDQATLTYVDENNETVTVNLWQRNMFAVRLEFEMGFVANVDAFNLLSGATPQA